MLEKVDLQCGARRLSWGMIDMCPTFRELFASRSLLFSLHAEVQGLLLLPLPPLSTTTIVTTVPTTLSRELVYQYHFFCSSMIAVVLDFRFAARFLAEVSVRGAFPEAVDLSFRVFLCGVGRQQATRTQVVCEPLVSRPFSFFGKAPTGCFDEADWFGFVWFDGWFVGYVCSPPSRVAGLPLWGFVR